MVWEVEFLGETFLFSYFLSYKSTLSARAYLLSIYSPLPPFLPSDAEPELEEELGRGTPTPFPLGEVSCPGHPLQVGIKGKLC